MHNLCHVMDDQCYVMLNKLVNCLFLPTLLRGYPTHSAHSIHPLCARCWEMQLRQPCLWVNVTIVFLQWITWDIPYSGWFSWLRGGPQMFTHERVPHSLAFAHVVYRHHENISMNWSKIHCSRKFYPPKIPAIWYWVFNILVKLNVIE